MGFHQRGSDVASATLPIPREAQKPKRPLQSTLPASTVARILPLVLKAHIDPPKRAELAVALAAAMALLLLSTGSLSAQGQQTGTLRGVVLGPDGGPLPDAQVTLLGPPERSARTNADGQFVFTSLPVGAHRVEASLLGLEATATARVFLNTSTTLTLQLRVQSDVQRSDESEGARAASPEEAPPESIVRALPPLVDRFSSRHRFVLSREFLDDLPLERFYQELVLLLPGANQLSSAAPQVHGALASSNLFLFDGMETSDPTTGQFSFNIPFEAIQEVEVTLAAGSSAYGGASGAVINVVTPSGRETNRLTGRLRFSLSRRDWNGDYPESYPRLLADSRAANGTSGLDHTVAATLAGPIVAERLFFFGSGETANSATDRPTIVGDLWQDDVEVSSALFKLTFEPSNQGQFRLGWHTDQNEATTFRGFAQDPGQSRGALGPDRFESTQFERLPGDLFALERERNQGEILSLNGSHRLHRSEFRVTAATQDQTLRGSARDESLLTSGAPHTATLPIATLDAEEIDLAGDDDQSLAVFNGLAGVGDEKRNRELMQIDFSTWMGSKLEFAIDTGIRIETTESTGRVGITGASLTDPATGRAVSGQQFDDADFSEECFEQGRCIDFDPLTGLFSPDSLDLYWQRPQRTTRAEQRSAYADLNLLGTRFSAALGARLSSVEANGRQPLADDTDVAPRIQLKWDLTGNADSFISGSYAQFVERFSHAFLDGFERDSLFSGFSRYLYSSSDDCLLDLDGAANPLSPCWEFLEAAPFFPRQFAPPNPTLERSEVEETLIRFERQLGRSVAISLSYVAKDWSQLFDDRLFFDANGEVTARVETLPEAQREYRGLQFVAQKRLADNWQVLLNYSYGRSRGNLFEDSGLSDFADFAPEDRTNLINREGRGPLDFRNQLRAVGQYIIRGQSTETALGAVLSYRSGTPFHSEQETEFGRLFLNRRGSSELEAVYQLDLSSSVDIRLSEANRLELRLEVRNATNESALLDAERDIESFGFRGPRGLNDLQRPRQVRFLIGIEF